jgi:hypothetical protein
MDVTNANLTLLIIITSLFLFISLVSAAAALRHAGLIESKSG